MYSQIRDGYERFVVYVCYRLASTREVFFIADRGSVFAYGKKYAA